SDDSTGTGSNADNTNTGRSASTLPYASVLPLPRASTGRSRASTGRSHASTGRSASTLPLPHASAGRSRASALPRAQSHVDDRQRL
ncbi:MAG: hypothetical protein GX574_12600, partial [Lentisphaerae bacterium]|nr:hypothetical protein [Lentisphaerota bacterium]